MKKLLCLLLLSLSSTQIFTSESDEEIEDNASYQAHQWIDEMCPEFFVTIHPGWYGYEDEDADQEGINSLKKGEYAKVNEECPYNHLMGKIVEINEISKEFWDFAMSNYLKTNPPAFGLIYYGYVEGSEYCFHESWLQKVGEKEGKEATAQQEYISVYKFVDKELHDVIDSLFADVEIKKDFLRRGINKERLIKLFVINGLRKNEDLKEIAIGTKEGVGILKFRVQLTNGKEFYLEGTDVIYGPIRMFNREKEEEQYWKRIGNSFKEEIVRYYFSHL